MNTVIAIDNFNGPIALNIETSQNFEMYFDGAIIYCESASDFYRIQLTHNLTNRQNNYIRTEGNGVLHGNNTIGIFYGEFIQNRLLFKKENLPFFKFSEAVNERLNNINNIEIYNSNNQKVNILQNSKIFLSIRKNG